MTVAGIAKSAVVRYLVYAALALVLGYFGIGHANAQTYSLCYTDQAGDYSAVCPDRQIAYEQALRVATLLNTEHIVIVCTFVSRPGYECLYKGTFGNRLASRYYQSGSACAAPKVWDDTLKTCHSLCDANAPPLSGGGWVHGDWANDVSMPVAVCSDSCKYFMADRPALTVSCVDGECWTKTDGFTAAGASCSASSEAPAPGDPPPPDTDKDGTSDGNDGSPNNPGKDGQGKDGPADKDTDGENSSGGGGDCGTPPNSSGDAIGAQIAYQTWATRCAIENAKDGNGNLKTTQGTGTGTGTGSETGNGSCGDGAVNAAICATKEYAKKLGDFVDGLTDHTADLDMDQGETEDPDKVWIDSPTEADLDASGFGWGSSCPAPPEYMGHSLDAAGNLCLFASIIGAFMLLGAYAQAAYIIGRS